MDTCFLGAGGVLCYDDGELDEDEEDVVRDCELMTSCFFRPKGPSICLAQANGLGIRCKLFALGPTARHFVLSHWS